MNHKNMTTDESESYTRVISYVTHLISTGRYITGSQAVDASGYPVVPWDPSAEKFSYPGAVRRALYGCTPPRLADSVFLYRMETMILMDMLEKIRRDWNPSYELEDLVHVKPNEIVSLTIEWASRGSRDGDVGSGGVPLEV